MKEPTFYPPSIEIKAPEDFMSKSMYYDKSVFLGGSIEMGTAENWQDELTKELWGINKMMILNPRRDDWDSTWEQKASPDTKFFDQVKWEMDAQDYADLCVYYFSPDTKSPITLLELGSYGVKKPSDVIVCCPNGFWRKGNVEMFCFRHNIRLYHTKEIFFEAVKVRLSI